MHDKVVKSLASRYASGVLGVISRWAYCCCNARLSTTQLGFISCGWRCGRTRLNFYVPAMFLCAPHLRSHILCGVIMFYPRAPITARDILTEPPGFEIQKLTMGSTCDKMAAKGNPNPTTMAIYIARPAHPHGPTCFSQIHVPLPQYGVGKFEN